MSVDKSFGLLRYILEDSARTWRTVVLLGALTAAAAVVATLLVLAFQSTGAAIAAGTGWATWITARRLPRRKPARVVRRSAG
ncbi:hypothetical protein [Saccharothrix sp.]|uniref:hypothetical protein n=1 Tax=Saccharothrix sp. TaxID=1873460 RepID=UPI002810F6EA|nr:hypothetical protein [Saccharothrix sp.]